jgi:hypothetical protein
MFISKPFYDQLSTITYTLKLKSFCPALELRSVRKPLFFYPFPLWRDRNNKKRDLHT